MGAFGFGALSSAAGADRMEADNRKKKTREPFARAALTDNIGRKIKGQGREFKLVTGVRVVRLAKCRLRKLGFPSLPQECFPNRNVRFANRDDEICEMAEDF